MQNSYSNSFAGFWARLFAYLIDQVIVFAVLLLVRVILSGVVSAAEGTPLGGNLLFQYDLKDIVLYLLQALYFITLTYYTGTTLGKRLMNLRVVPAVQGQKLSLLTVIYRETIGRFLSSVFVCIGYLLIAVDKEKRGFHDILCDTRVIYAKKVKVYETKIIQNISISQMPPQSTGDGYRMVQNTERDS